MVDEAMANRPHKIDGRQVRKFVIASRSLSTKSSLTHDPIYSCDFHFHLQVQPKRAVPREETNPASHMAIKKIFIGGKFPIMSILVQLNLRLSFVKKNFQKMKIKMTEKR